VTVRSI